jgi:hypothetical protein
MEENAANTSPESGFRWSDAWVLASVAVGGGLKGARLKEILAAGELINRAILEAGELRDGLGKLLYRGFVEQRDGAFVVAGRARTAVEGVLSRQQPSFSVMQFFEEFLNVDPYSTDSVQVDGSWPVEGVSDEDVRAAAHAYREELNGIWRELRTIDQAPLPERAMYMLAVAGRGGMA